MNDSEKGAPPQADTAAAVPSKSNQPADGQSNPPPTHVIHSAGFTPSQPATFSSPPTNAPSILPAVLPLPSQLQHTPSSPPPSNGGLAATAAPARSFLQALRPPPTSIISDVQLEDHPTQPPEDINDITVSFSISEMQSIEAKFQYTLILKFTTGCPKLTRVKEDISNWGLAHVFFVVPMNPRHVILHLTSADDFLWVRTRGSRSIGSSSFRLFKWSAEFCPTEESPLAAVWVSFPNPNLMSFIPAVLKRMANSFGKFLTIAEETSSFSRANSAKVCVELDLSKPLPTFLKIAAGNRGMFNQPIHYLSNIKFCHHYKLQGHASNDCYRAQPVIKKTPTSSLPTNQNLHIRFADSSGTPSKNKPGSALLHSFKQGG